MSFQTTWFLLIAVLWVGYFILEGFDFGVGALLPFVSRNEADRRAVLTTLGPVWDGNEVWLLVAGGATFAAFPEWYATLFSGFYLPLFLILVSLIVRGVAFEYRSKYGKAQWRQRWDIAIVISSAVPALLWGVAFANIVRGVPIKMSEAGNLEYVGGFFNLLNPYALLGGVVTLSVFLTHGAIFLSLKTFWRNSRPCTSVCAEDWTSCSSCSSHILGLDKSHASRAQHNCSCTLYRCCTRLGGRASCNS